jgi:uncharacterized protein YggE
MRTALPALVAIGLCGIAEAQDPATVGRSITVTGIGEAAGRPDQARISAGVQTLAATVAESSRENQAIVERIMKALDAHGIGKKDIQTANYSIWPEQRPDPSGSGQMTISAYNVSNVVNVTVNDIDTVGELLAAVTNAGANSIQGINFGVKDTAALEQRARAAAIADASARATALAELAGVKLGEVQTISMYPGGGYPAPMLGGARFDMAAAAPVPGISEGQFSVTVQVQLTFAIR